MRAIDGRAIAQKMECALKKRAAALPIFIATVVADGTPESWIFARLKDRACQRVGIRHAIVDVDGATSERVAAEVHRLNRDDAVTGINLQLPLPAGIDYADMVGRIAVEKDIEGMHQAWLKSVLLQVTLWSQPYMRHDDF